MDDSADFFAATAGLTARLDVLLMPDLFTPSLLAVVTLETVFLTADIPFYEIAAPGLGLAAPIPVLLDEFPIVGFPDLDKS